MGLKVRHNGVITDLSGNEYDPSGLGTKRLKIRAGGSVKEFGLTTDPHASSYCGLNVKVGGSKYYIGRKSTSLETSTYTETNQSTRHGNATRSSSYEVNTNSTGLEYAGTESRVGYNYSYTYSGSSKGTIYTLFMSGSNTGSTYLSGNVGTHTVQYYSGSSWTRTYSDRWWERDYASTNGVKTGGWVTQQGAWGAGVSRTSDFSYMTTLVSNSRKSGANQSEAGSFVGNRTSIYWRYVSSWKTSRAYEITKTCSTSYSGFGPEYDYYSLISSKTVIQANDVTHTSPIFDPNDFDQFIKSQLWYSNIGVWCNGANRIAFDSMVIDRGVSTIAKGASTINATKYEEYPFGSYIYNHTQSGDGWIYGTHTRYVSNNSSIFTKTISSDYDTYRYTVTNYNTTTSHYTVSSSRQSDYTYESQYTATDTKTSSNTLITHNFV